MHLVINLSTSSTTDPNIHHNTWWWLLLWLWDMIYIHTCAQEEHLVVAVSSHDLVHCHRCVFVVGVGPDHQRSPPHWVDGVEHDWMVPYECHHVVWELLRCLDVRCEGSTGTLERRKEVSVLCFFERYSHILQPNVNIASFDNLQTCAHYWQNTRHTFMWHSLYVVVIEIIDNNMYSLLIIHLNVWRLNMESRRGPCWSLCLFYFINLWRVKDISV